MKKVFSSAVLLFTPVFIFGQSLFERYEAILTQPRSYTCFRTIDPIKIDGKLKEYSWSKASSSEPFVDISGYDFETPSKQTTVKMLWDDEYLYIAAILEEDNIVAKLSQRDTIIYRENDFEVFIDPDCDGVFYFEIENNAKGTIMDLMLDKAYRSGGSFFLPWNCEGLQLAVSHDGTLNKTNDIDRSWTVEMAIPFSALTLNFNNPKQYSTWRINFSRVQYLVPYAPAENWVWSPTGKVDMHMPERWGFLNFVDAPVGSKKVENVGSSLDQGAYKLIWAMFYAQMDNKLDKHNYLRTIKDFFLTQAELESIGVQDKIEVEASSDAFTITISLPESKEYYSVNQDGKFSIGKIEPKVVKNWMWMRFKPDWSDEQYREHFEKLRACGISAVLFEGYEENVYKICKEVGLEAHYWKWTLNRSECMETHPEWFAVNRKGESSYDKPAYVDYYRFLCPSREEVADYLAEDYLALSNLPYVDGMHLDYVRFPDVILPVSLWQNYGIEQKEELPEYDFCYCEVCREKFKALTGRDPLEIEYPMEDQSWLNFRYDAVTGVVKAIASKLMTEGKELTAAVFPGPSMAKKMVRQDWASWPLVAYFPMIYNGFYYEGPEWIGRSVAESVKAVGGRAQIYAGLMFPDIMDEDFEKALYEAYGNGASGVSFFDGPDYEYLERLKAYMDSHDLLAAE